MRTKTRLTLWLGILTLLVLLLGGISLGTIWNMGSEGKDVLTANYNSIDYAQRMLEAIDAEGDTARRSAVLLEQLVQQQANITEVGEAELTEQIGSEVRAFRASPGDVSITRALRRDLNGIIDLNRQAIVRKAEDAEDRADIAFLWISIAGTLCFLITFTLFLSLPERLTEPIRILTEGIDRIAAGDYRERVEIEGQGEFGHMARRFNAMATELERWENSNLARVMDEKARAEAVINSLQDASIGLDDQGRVLFINRQALELLGLNEEDTTGRIAMEVAQRNDLLRHVLGDRSGAPFKAVVDGKENYFISVSTPIQGTQGVLGTVFTVRNITPFQERDQAKTQFLATISHELKTPLASTDIGLTLLERNADHLTAEQRAITADLRRDHQRLVKIVSELLDLAQVETGNIRLEMAAVPVGQIVAGALEATRASAQEREVRIVSDLAEDIGAVNADADKATWVLVNLLTNAIRYSPRKGTVTIRARMEGSGTELTVQDEGPGVAPALMPHLFERFAQHATPDHKGTGLGLAISRDLMQAMGGAIVVADTGGKGARFTLTFRRV